MKSDFDQSVLDKLLSDVGAASLPILIQAFHSEIDSFGPDLDKFFAAGMAKQISIRAHALKSAAYSMGAIGLGDACFQLEQEALAGVPDDQLASVISTAKEKALAAKLFSQNYTAGNR